MNLDKTLKKPQRKNIFNQKIKEQNSISFNESTTLREDFNEKTINIFEFPDKYTYKQFIPYENIIQENLKIKQYYLTKYITRGGEGMIFEGVRYINNEIQSKFIFKICSTHFEEDIDQQIKIMKLFERNINTIQLIDFLKINSELFILVMEKCEYSLKDELLMIQKNEIQFTRQKLFFMVFDLLDGLIQFRIHNILHLDIKPSNILVSQQGSYVYTDFGLSSIFFKNQSVFCKGYTRVYSSNEQINNLPSIDFKSDVYSLGKTFEKIIWIYQQKNQEDKFIQSFVQIIINDMIQPFQGNREECLQLHDKFIQLFMKNLETKIIQQYENKINQIIQLIPFDQNKDIPYYSKLKLYYQKLILKFKTIMISNSNPIKQKFASNQNYDEQIFNLFDDSQNPFLDFYEIKKFIFKENYIDIVQSMNNIGSCYKSLGDYQMLQDVFKILLKLLNNFQMEIIQILHYLQIMLECVFNYLVIFRKQINIYYNLLK